MTEAGFDSCQQIQQGRWEKEEHKKFLEGIIEHGKDWKIIETIVKTRLGSQVRSHSQKFFIKLNKINKQRRKGKNKDLLSPTEIEQQILDWFTQHDITQNTPTEIANLLQHDWSKPMPQLNTKKRQPKQKHLNEVQKLIMSSLPSKRKETIPQESKIEPAIKLHSEEQQDNEQSFFIKILKMKKQQFKNTIDFKNLFDFGIGQGQQPVTMINQSQQAINPVQGQYFHKRVQVTQTHPPMNLHLPEIPQARQRRRSFGLPDQEQNSEKLKETLDNLHRMWGVED